MNTKGEPMDIILTEDLESKISQYDDKIYDLVRDELKDTESYEQMRVEIYDAFDDMYHLSDKDDTLSEAKEKYLRDFIDSYMKEKIVDFNHRTLMRKDILDKLALLKKLELPEQRSEEWYKIREGILTASSLADAIGEGHFSTKDQLLIQKCGGPRGEVPFHIVEWGVMYEPVATKFYELINHLTVLEFGLVPHPEFKIFGASPDGICDSDSPPDYVGRMLEIKCPPKRKFTKEVPRHYWMQMQGQLESCNLEECDFLQVKFIEYFNEQEYNDDLIMDDGDEIKEGYSSNNLPKGQLLAFVKDNPEGNPTIRYEYSDFYQSYDDLKEWSSKRINEYQESEYEYDRVVNHWWKIERYECSLVGRDRKWWLSVQPKIIDFWSDVLYYREVGIQVFHDKKAEKKTKKIKIKGTQKKKNTFEIDKAVVEKIQNNYLIEDSD